ncbi:MAG: ATP-binding protein [Sandaracinaceae bacterium]
MRGRRDGRGPEARHEAWRRRHRAWKRRWKAHHDQWHREHREQARAGRRRCRRRRRHPPRLQRRIFYFFGATILFTIAIVALLGRALMSDEPWRDQARGVERFLAARLAEDWHEPAERDALVRDLHRELGADVALRDAQGAMLARAGRPCEDPWLSVPVRVQGAEAGVLAVCGGPSRPPVGRLILMVLVALLIFWSASGLLARRLMRPLRRLEGLAHRLGEGDLEARSGMTPEREGELGVLGQALDAMAERIERQIADQRELLAAVSHELRTPLGHLRVLLDLARETPEQAHLDDMEREVLEVDALVGQLLASSRLDFGSLDPRPVDPVEVAARALERAALDPDGLAVDGFAEGPPLVEADPTLLARALANLLKNAESHGGGLLRLVVEEGRAHVRFAVEDAGPGFTPEEREQVFAPFFRGEHRAGASLGLGLALVRRIAEAHGGYARIEERAGGGARVVMAIARHPAAVADESAPAGPRG